MRVRFLHSWAVFGRSLYEYLWVCVCVFMYIHEERETERQRRRIAHTHVRAREHTHTRAHKHIHSQSHTNTHKHTQTPTNTHKHTQQHKITGAQHNFTRRGRRGGSECREQGREGGGGRWWEEVYGGSRERGFCWASQGCGFLRCCFGAGESIMNASCHVWKRHVSSQRVMSRNVCMSHVTHCIVRGGGGSQRCQSRELHMWNCFMSHMNELCRIWMSHVTRCIRRGGGGG